MERDAPIVAPLILSFGEIILKKNRMVIYGVLLLLLGIQGILLSVSYDQYFVVSKQAYSGNATEFLVVEGRLIFFYFNNYEGPLPPQQIYAGFAKKSTPGGKRLYVEFDFSESSSWWNRNGFVWHKESDNAIYGYLRIVSVPCWFILIISLVFSALVYRRLLRAEQPSWI